MGASVTISSALSRSWRTELSRSSRVSVQSGGNRNLSRSGKALRGLPLIGRTLQNLIDGGEQRLRLQAACVELEAWLCFAWLPAPARRADRWQAVPRPARERHAWRGPREAAPECRVLTWNSSALASARAFRLVARLIWCRKCYLQILPVVRRSGACRWLDKGLRRLKSVCAPG